MTFQLYLALRDKKRELEPKGVGFTGTSDELTDRQLHTLGSVLPATLHNYGNILHHGDCIKSDEAAHKIAKTAHAYIVIHPPINEYKRAFCKGANLVLDPKEFLERNKDIVLATRILVATPGTMKPILRSGTWSTIRFATKMDKAICFIFPDSSVRLELPGDRRIAA